MIKHIRILLIWVVILTYQVTEAHFSDYEDMIVSDNQSDLVLPDVLRSQDGKKIRNKKQWEKVRRPEILKLFEDHMYGQLPSDYDDIKFTLITDNPLAMEGKSHFKEVFIDVSRNNQSVGIRLFMFVPNAVHSPGVFLLINHRSAENTDPTRDVKSDFWPAELAIERGYAIAAFHVSDVAEDNPDTYHKGVISKLYPEQLTMESGMNALGAWAWGASRIMDYLVTDKSIDAERVAVIGHSRSGKAALWCGAQDERFAMVISNNSGCGGAALSRRMVGETLKVMNTNFPHWLSESNLAFNDNVNNLPIDQHMLLSLIAPRAIAVGSASEDRWADPVGEFMSLKYAEPVYRFYKTDPLPADNQPEADKPVFSSHLAYHIRSGRHNLTRYDWEQYFNFADLHYRRKK